MLHHLDHSTAFYSLEAEVPNLPIEILTWIGILPFNVARMRSKRKRSSTQLARDFVPSK